jgi:hypothetical protein
MITSPPNPLSMKWRGVHPEGFTLKETKGERLKIRFLLKP